MSKHKYSKEFLDRTGLSIDNINPRKVPESDLVTQDTPPDETAPNFTSKAIGLHRVRDGGGHKYTLVEIEYDPVTNRSGKIKECNVEHSKEEIVNLFKFKVDELNLFFYEDRND